MKLKLIHIIAEVEKSHHFEWISLQLKADFDYQCILIGRKDSEHERFLTALGIKVYALEYRSKRSMFSLASSLLKILRKEKPAIVHTHFWVASLVGIPVAWMLRVPVKMITRHHGDLHHKYYPKGVMLDRTINFLADHIITPTTGIRELVIDKESTPAHKVTVINHGVDLDFYQNVTPERADAVREKYSIPRTAPVIGMISRYVQWKGIEYAIEAFRKIQHDYPDAHLVLANANGEYRSVLRQKLSQLQPAQYTEINYEGDTPALYALFDVFVHVPIDRLSESFGLIYVEALAAGRPSVFTISGVAADFVRDGYNALVVDYRNAEQITEAVLRILKDSELRRQLTSNGAASVQHFSYVNMCRQMKELYHKLAGAKGLI
jgi:glycosyltransferase involved in cell wall biosynthesis